MTQSPHRRPHADILDFVRAHPRGMAFIIFICGLDALYMTVPH